MFMRSGREGRVHVHEKNALGMKGNSVVDPFGRCVFFPTKYKAKQTVDWLIPWTKHRWGVKNNWKVLQVFFFALEFDIHKKSEKYECFMTIFRCYQNDTIFPRDFWKISENHSQMKTHKSFSFRNEEKENIFFQFRVINFNVTLAYLFIWDLDFRLSPFAPLAPPFSNPLQSRRRVKKSTFMGEELENSKE